MRLPNYAASVAVAFLALSAPSFASPPARPAAPQVTMGADLKLLRFDWEPVAGASFYRLWIKPGGSRYISVGERIPASITHAEHSIGVHLQDWARTRYVVTACNSAGCTGSAALNPSHLMLDTIGYLKASNTDPDDHFGREVTLSSDGLTLAVSAEHESSAATGVNGDQSDNSSTHSGAVYIFRRTGSGWRQEAYLKPPVNRAGVNFGVGVALSSDGSIAAIAASGQIVANVDLAGEVYVFRRGSNGSWSHIATLRAPEPRFADFFGYSVDMSLDGSTIKVSALHQGGEVELEGRTHIFDRSGSTWVHKATLVPFYAGDACSTVRMSGDGRTLVAHCSSPSGFRAVTFKRHGDSWLHAADLALPAAFHQPLALNFDATAMALTESRGYSAVVIYRWEGSSWMREADIASPENLPRTGFFGYALAFNRDGRRLAIGDYLRQVEGVGVFRSVTLGGAPPHGAVFLYERSGALPSPWQFLSVVKAPNPGVEDLFGLSVSLSGSGRTLAVGTFGEDSNARGIDGDQTNEDATDAGAAYLY